MTSTTWRSNVNDKNPPSGYVVACRCGNEDFLNGPDPFAHALERGWQNIAPDDPEGWWVCPEYPGCREEWDEDDE